MRAVFLNDGFSAFICKFLRNFHNMPNVMNILNLFQETIQSDEAN